MSEQEIKLQLERWRGWSAYEVAVQNGFEGTEAEWLASLKGKDGLVNALVANNLDTTEEGYVLDARQGALLKQQLDSNTNATAGKVGVDSIVNDLTTGGADKVLSAEQGKVLAERIATKASVYGTKIEVTTTDWEGDGPYTKDVALSGVTADEETCHVIVIYSPGYKTEYQDTELELVAQKADSVTVQVSEKPSSAFPVNVLIVHEGVSA